jgi:glucose/arabinose dehydrogenase
MRMGTFRRWTWAAIALAAFVAGGCSDGGGDSLPTDNVPQVTVNVERVFPNLTFTAPVAMLQAPGDNTRWFVVEQSGVVRVFPNSQTVGPAGVSVFANISNLVAFEGEAGLLGMAFHPEFSTNATQRRVFLFYSRRDTGGALESRLSEFVLNSSLNVDPASEKMLLTIRKPQTMANPQGESNHNGGNIAFGPEPGNLLYLGIGDGGGGNDQHGLIGNGQSTTTLLGKMLRIIVPQVPGAPYGIPADNPNAGNALCNANGSGTLACPEIFALGFRNPWRWSFDRSNGQLWVGDVGQQTLEEIDKVVLGGNYGWRCFEGTRNTGLCSAPGQPILPVAQYGRGAGASVTGGFVYRGSRFPGLVGRYIFADFISGNIFNIDSAAQGPLTLAGGFSSGLGISSFGQDVVDGELYVVHYGDGQTSTGQLFRIRQ